MNERQPRYRSIRQVVRAIPVSEGAGVTVHRTLGTPALRMLDPFLMLDHFSSSDPDEYIAGFPDHPHRGFITLTYMLDGRMLHEDSMGNRGELEPGGAQWMKAASGVIHSEMPRQRDGLMRGFQLWINLPAREKMSEPAYRDLAPGEIPEVAHAGVRVRVLSGEFEGTRGPLADPNTALQFLDVTLAPGTFIEHALDPSCNALVYVFEGRARVGDQATEAHRLAVLDTGDAVRIGADEAAARLILVAGRPLGEPVVQYGPFVMNTQDEIRQAFADYRAGTLVRSAARRE